MKLSEFCIKRPVFTTVLSLILIVIGIIGFFGLTVREMPNINFPTLTIETVYPGANPDLVENEITNPIEETLANIDGLNKIESSSSQNLSDINIRFNIGADLNVGASEVRDKLASLADTLPTDAHNPVLYRWDSNDMETAVLGFTSINMSLLQLTDYITRYIKPQLEQIEGIAKVNVVSSEIYAMRLWLNPYEMAIKNVSVTDVVNALKAQNASISSGQIKSLSRYYSVTTLSKLKSADEFNKIIIRNDNGYLIRFEDIGKAELASEETEQTIRLNTKPAVGISIYTQAEANPLMVSVNLNKKLKEMQDSLPTGVKGSIIFDATKYVRASINNVYITVIESGILVLLVIFLFLGSLRATAIPIITIPICLIAVFGFLYFVNYSINEITLLALVLAIGLVVDDAIVMLENIHRHVENGEHSLLASIKGSREIGFAIIAMSITLAAVYAPIAFIPGLTGIIFREFAFTLAMAVLISGFIALTLSPMMCARLITTSKTRYSYWLDKSFTKLITSYKKLLTFILNHRLIIVIILFLLIIGGFFIFNSMGSELAPAEDEGLFQTLIQAPTNASFDYINNYCKKAESIIMQIPERSDYISIVDSPNSRIFTILKPWSQRKRSQMQITTDVNKQLQQLPGVTAFAVTGSGVIGGGMRGNDFEIVIMTTKDYQRLATISEQVAQELKNWPGFSSIDNSLKMNSEQFSVAINRDLAANLNINMDDIASTLSTLIGGNQVTYFEYDGLSYDVILQMPLSIRQNPDILQNLYVRSTTNNMVPLASLINISTNVAPVTLPHYNRLRSATITAQIKPGYNMGEAINYVKNLMKDNLPDDAKYTFTGPTQNYLESSNQMTLIFTLAIIFIYLILGAQFESFIDPLIILLTIPLSIVGALFTLKLAGGTLNIFSEIGFVTLIGLISKHGILITEFANQLRAQGKNLHEAIIEAASLRIRPILMTTFAMGFGALPLALATGAGAHSRQQIGWVIVGGLFFGTFFSLIVVPVAYSYLARFSKPARSRRTKIVTKTSQ